MERILDRGSTPLISTNDVSVRTKLNRIDTKINQNELNLNEYQLDLPDIDTLRLQEGEVADVKLVTFEEFDKMIENGKVVPSINPSYSLMKNFNNCYIN